MNHYESREAELGEEAMREAADDYVWLRSRGYPKSSSLALVGDRFSVEGGDAALVELAPSAAVFPPWPRRHA